jgi:pyruvate-formate lyase-activating enzyme
MRSGLLPARVVHVHPTRACNLSCAHCYSSSSPGIRSSLHPEFLLEALRVLRGDGYEVLSISGGEPLVYRGLVELVLGAVALGYRVHIVTNGLLLTKARLAALQGHVHLIAVSFDGAEEIHNQVRGRPDAFRKANAALEVLAEAQVPFGMAFGVSRRSLADLPWAFTRASEVGASLLHLRPLVKQGRARELPDDWMLSQEDCARVVLIGDLLNAGPAHPPRVQVDLATSQELIGARSQFEVLQEGGSVTALSDAVNPLVIDERGRCLAFTYGIHPRFTVADLKGDWRGELARFKCQGIQSITRLLEAAFERAAGEGDGYLDWFEHLTAVSHSIPGSASLAAGH